MMEEREPVPDRFNGVLDGFEISVHLDRHHPGGAKHSIELNSKDRKKKYEVSYTFDTMVEGLRVHLFENVGEAHRFIFRKLNERS